MKNTQRNIKPEGVIVTFINFIFTFELNEMILHKLNDFTLTKFLKRKEIVVIL